MAGTDVTAGSFEAVKEYVVKKFPEFGSVVLRFCRAADAMYEESKAGQAQEGKPPRVYAHVLHYENTVCATQKMCELSEGQRQGIFAHEFGHLYAQRHPDDGYDSEEDADADFAATSIFGINLRYDDDDIEYVNLPLGSEPVEDSMMTEEELQEAIDEIGEEEESEEEEEEGENEYGLDVASPDDIKRSLELVPEEAGEEEAREISDEGPVIDAEMEG